MGAIGSVCFVWGNNDELIWRCRAIELTEDGGLVCVTAKKHVLNCNVTNVISKNRFNILKNDYESFL
jgi:hypothetical protein